MAIKIRSALLLWVAAALSPCAIGQNANASLTLLRGSVLACPVNGSVVSLFLENNSSNPQPILAQTKLTLLYSAPVLRAPSSTAAAALSFSGNTVTAVFSQDTTIAAQTSLGFLNAALNLQGLADGTPVGVTISVAPSSALAITGQNTGTVLATVDLPSCTTQALPPVTVDDLTASCPSAEEIAVIRADLNITFEGDPSAGTLVCRAADGSADLTRLQERTYQGLRIMHQISFDTPVPWTSKSIYDWLVSAITGIRHRTDITNTFCCDPANTINVASRGLGILNFLSSEWVSTQGVLYAHEARHNQGFLHTCGSSDQTLDELGAWGVQYYMQEWMTRHSDPFLTPRDQTALNFRTWFWQGAQSMINNTICDLESGVVGSPRKLDFRTQPVGVASVPKALAITLTKGVGTSINGIALNGANAGDFTIVRDTCTGATILPSCAVDLSFTPGAAAQRSAALVFNYGAALSQSVPLAGTGGGSTCGYSLATSGGLQSNAGGSGNVTITAAPGCAWTASSKSSWLGMNPASGIGNGVVSFIVAKNPRDGARQGVLAIADQTVAVAQAGLAIPQFHATGITNAASLVQTVSPGSIVTIFGTGLTRNVTGVVAADHTPLPTQLAGTSVEWVASDASGKLSHLVMPLLAVANVGGQEQINFQIPWEAIAPSTGEIEVHNNGLTGSLLNYTIRATSPGLFTVDGTAGAFVHGADNSLVTASSPADRGEVVVLYATGLGAVNPPSTSGQPAASVEPLSRTIDTPIVTIGGISAKVLFSGLAPNYVGLYQLNVVVPSNSPIGNIQVVVQAGGFFSKAATMFVR